jgi:hypothetical protein
MSGGPGAGRVRDSTTIIDLLRRHPGWFGGPAAGRAERPCQIDAARARVT